MATRQVGDETLSPRAYDVTMRWALERTEARVRQRVAGAAGPDEMLDAVFVDPELIEGTFLTWLQRDDWRTSHPEFKARCHESLRALLGAGR